MDEDSGPAVTRGGAVEPANRAAVAKERSQTPADAVGERYEHRDPFADVTYRVKTFDEMVAKAEQLGTSRFYAVSEEGKRTPINKVNGVWQRTEEPPVRFLRGQRRKRDRHRPRSCRSPALPSLPKSTSPGSTRKPRIALARSGSRPPWQSDMLSSAPR